MPPNRSCAVAALAAMIESMATTATTVMRNRIVTTP